MTILCAHCKQHYLEPEHPKLYRAGLEYATCDHCGGQTARLKNADITRETFRRYLDMMIRAEQRDNVQYGKQGVY